MAKGGRFALDVDYGPFTRRVEAAVSKVERGTKKATIAACEEIKRMTLAEVPRDTQALADSFFYEIHGSYRDFTAVIGYGGNGDPINPKQGRAASSYMVAVHEDLGASHPIGKAKFFEDPIRNYQSRFNAQVGNIIKSELR